MLVQVDLVADLEQGESYLGLVAVLGASRDGTVVQLVLKGGCSSRHMVAGSSSNLAAKQGNSVCSSGKRGLLARERCTSGSWVLLLVVDGGMKAFMLWWPKIELEQQHNSWYRC